MNENDLFPTSAQPQVWRIFDGLQPYMSTVKMMQAHAATIRSDGAAEEIWLLQHEPIYTGGTSALEADLLAPGSIPAVRNGRGGQWTYHGPGQRIAYIMLDIAARDRDVRLLINKLESWVIATLYDFGVKGQRRQGMPGIWVQTGNSLSGMDKIAAIGIRISHWVSWHGLAINLNPDLAAFEAIVPCGVRDGGVTSLAALDIDVSMEQLDQKLQVRFHDFF